MAKFYFYDKNSKAKDFTSTIEKKVQHYLIDINEFIKFVEERTDLPANDIKESIYEMFNEKAFTIEEVKKCLNATISAVTKTKLTYSQAKFIDNLIESELDAISHHDNIEIIDIFGSNNEENDINVNNINNVNNVGNINQTVSNNIIDNNDCKNNIDNIINN